MDRTLCMLSVHRRVSPCLPSPERPAQMSYWKWARGGQIEKNEVGGACGTHGRGEISAGFWWEGPKGRYNLEERGVDGIKMDLRENGWEGVEWIQLAQDRDRWRTLVNTVINLRVLGPRSWPVRTSGGDACLFTWPPAGGILVRAGHVVPLLHDSVRQSRT
jgi:hypothetical protein